MKYSILLSGRAEKQLNKIAKKEQKLIARGISDLIKFSETTSGNIKKLKTPFPGYRKRVGNYRILFEVDKGAKRIIIYKIGHRKDIYK